MMITLAYTAIALCVIRPMAGHFAWSWYHSDATAHNLVTPDPGPLRWLLATISSAILSVVWPAVVIWTLTGMLGPVGSERRQQSLDRERKIKELEEELQ